MAGTGGHGPRAGGLRLRWVELLERAKNAVFYTPGLTLAALTEIALVTQLDRLERKYGGPYPARTAALRVGRPVR